MKADGNKMTRYGMTCIALELEDEAGYETPLAQQLQFWNGIGQAPVKLLYEEKR